MPCRFAAKSPRMMMVQAVTAVVVHGGAREFRRQGGRGQGRSRRGNGGRTSNGNNSSLNSNNSSQDFNWNGNSHGGSSAASAQGVCGIDCGNQASGRGRERARIIDKTTADAAGTVTTLPSMGRTTAPSASRMRLRMPGNRPMLCRSVLHGSRGSI